MGRGLQVRARVWGHTPVITPGYCFVMTPPCQTIAGAQEVKLTSCLCMVTGWKELIGKRLKMPRPHFVNLAIAYGMQPPVRPNPGCDAAGRSRIHGY